MAKKPGTDESDHLLTCFIIKYIYRWLDYELEDDPGRKRNSWRTPKHAAVHGSSGKNRLPKFRRKGLPISLSVIKQRISANTKSETKAWWKRSKGFSWLIPPSPLGNSLQPPMASIVNKRAYWLNYAQITYLWTTTFTVSKRQQHHTAHIVPTPRKPQTISFSFVISTLDKDTNSYSQSSVKHSPKISSSLTNVQPSAIRSTISTIQEDSVDRGK